MNATEIIEQARDKAGLSQRSAAASAALSDSRWRQIIDGHPTPVETLALMALAVGLTPADLTDAEHPDLPDAMSRLTPTYEASSEMRLRLGAVARAAMAEHGMTDYRDLAKEASGTGTRVTKGVARNFLNGHPWPTAPELKAICRALGWDFQRVEDLVWSGKDPHAVTAPSLSIKTTTTWAEPVPASTGGTIEPLWQDHEERIGRLEQALADYLQHPTTEEAARVMRRLQDPPVPPPQEAFDLAADWPDREKRMRNE